MDNELFMKLYGAYQKELYLYLYSLCRNRHQAEDLLHETFLKALLALPDGHTNMRAWLYMVARNLFYNQQKKKSKEILTEEQNVVPEESTNGELLENILAEESRRLLYQSIEKFLKTYNLNTHERSASYEKKRENHSSLRVIEPRRFRQGR